jgi:hypothetical protein
MFAGTLLRISLICLRNLAVFGFSFSGLIARAQDDSRGTSNFFSRDFVSSLGSSRMVKPEETTPNKSPERKAASAGYLGSQVSSGSVKRDIIEDENSANSSGGEGFFGSLPNPTETPTPTRPPLVRSSEEKILSVSGLVAGVPIKDGLIKIAEAGVVLRERGIPSRNIGIVCDPLEFGETIEKIFEPLNRNPELMQGFIWISPGFEILGELPERYKNLIYSPVWLIETSKGETIVEGDGPSLDEMIGGDGEFQQPTGGEEIKITTPTQKPKMVNLSVSELENSKSLIDETNEKTGGLSTGIGLENSTKSRSLEGDSKEESKVDPLNKQNITDNLGEELEKSLPSAIQLGSKERSTDFFDTKERADSLRINIVPGQ